jgi:hypothetical protein
MVVYLYEPLGSTRKDLFSQYGKHTTAVVSSLSQHPDLFVSVTEDAF